jgi:hypothetical protein
MLVLVMIPILALIGIYLFRSVQFQSHMAHESFRHQQAMAVAEAGVEDAILRLNERLATSNRWYSTGASPVNFQGSLTDRQGRTVGEYSVTIIEPRSDRPTVISRSFIPSATSPDSMRIVQVTTELPPPTCDWGVFAYNSLSFDQDFVMDSYDSTVAPYDPLNPGTNGDMGGGELVDAYYDRSTVLGDIQVGGTVSYGGWLNVTGYIAEGEPGIPPPPYPDQALLDAKAVNNNASVEITELDGTPDSIGVGTALVLGKEKIITFPPGDYFFTRIELGRDCVIRTDPAGPARIFIEAPSPGDMAIVLGQHCDVNVDPYSADPHTLWLYVKQGDIQIDQAGDIYGVVFAPDSDVQIDQNGAYYGAVVGSDVHLDAGGGFHYDESLGTGIPEVKGTLVTSWTEVLPNNNRVTNLDVVAATY